MGIDGKHENERDGESSIGTSRTNVSGVHSSTIILDESCGHRAYTH